VEHATSLRGARPHAEKSATCNLMGAVFWPLTTPVSTTDQPRLRHAGMHGPPIQPTESGFRHIVVEIG
jgi:hypothetical protein